MTQEDYFRTSDTTLASYLITENYFLLRIDYDNPRFEFIFADSTKLRGVANNFITGNALTDPVVFSRVNRKLLRVIRKQVQWEDD